MQVRVQQIGPGFVQQVQSVCTDCGGKGETINPKDRCKHCNGKKVVRNKKILEVHIDKGMADGQRITFSGEGDQEPGKEAGDIIIVLDEKEHEVFKRDGDDLLFSLHIKLVEALCGFQRGIDTLDGRTLVITCLPGEVVKNGAIKSIINEGMPHYRSPCDRGQMVVQFVVDFPDRLAESAAVEIERLLPPRPEYIIPDDAEMVSMADLDPSQEQQRQRHAYEEDDDMQGRSGGVRCQTQ